MLKAFYLSVIIVFSCSVTYGQVYSLQQLEALFLQNNYALLASKFNIDKAEADIVQEKLWNNPTLNIGEINLWTNRNSEELPPLFGRNNHMQQISVELEQLIETAGKRRKRTDLKKLEKNTSLLDYEELMRDLKKELRQSYYDLYTILKEKEQLQTAVVLFEQLYEQYKKQSELQNIAKSEMIRVQSELILLQKEITLLEKEKIEALRNLRLLAHLPTLSEQMISFVGLEETLHAPIPLDIKAIALEQHMQIKRLANEHQIAEKQLDIEKAQQKPDITLQMNYDRGGNIMQDFVGVGMSLDLPIFNRNKGNIKIARYEIEQQKVYRSAVESELETKINSLVAQLQQYQNTLNKWSVNQADGEQLLLENFRKHLQNKQITLLEFIDFTQAWRESYQAIIEVKKEYLNTYEELQYVVGQDF